MKSAFGKTLPQKPMYYRGKMGAWPALIVGHSLFVYKVPFCLECWKTLYNIVFYCNGTANNVL